MVAALHRARVCRVGDGGRISVACAASYASGLSDVPLAAHGRSGIQVDRARRSLSICQHVIGRCDRGDVPPVQILIVRCRPKHEVHNHDLPYVPEAGNAVVVGDTDSVGELEGLVDGEMEVEGENDGDVVGVTESCTHTRVCPELEKSPEVSHTKVMPLASVVEWYPAEHMGVQDWVVVSPSHEV